MKPPCIGFAQIKTILDGLVEGREENLPLLHGHDFGWADKAMLARAVVRPNGTGNPLRLIEPSLVGNGRARETFLYQALTTGVRGFERMPLWGPYAGSEQLAAIENWINAGMPD